jgi:hypothetical protein
MTPKEISKGLKQNLWQKASHREKELIILKLFSPMSSKDSFRIIMALVAHYDLELHRIDVKTAFLNGNLQEIVYMTQPKGFAVEVKEHMGCKLKKSLYVLK